MKTDRQVLAQMFSRTGIVWDDGGFGPNVIETKRETSMTFIPETRFLFTEDGALEEVIAISE